MQEVRCSCDQMVVLSSAPPRPKMIDLFIDLHSLLILFSDRPEGQGNHDSRYFVSLWNGPGAQH